MKQILIMMIGAMLMMVGGKDLRIVVMTPTPQMHCQNCENKIKSQMRFEAGVVKVETSVEKQTVSITYNPKKTNVEQLQAAMKRIGYDTKVTSDRKVERTKKNK